MAEKVNLGLTALGQVKGQVRDVAFKLYLDSQTYVRATLWPDASISYA